jgi:hypothetical protein
MPNWKSPLSSRLNLSRLSPQLRDEIIAELGSYLDDLYQHYCAQGLSDAKAEVLALNEINDARRLSQNIQRAKNGEDAMNHRTKQLWLPGLINLTVAMLILMFEVRTDLNPHLYHTQFGSIPIYFPWLATLPFCGALAAYFSRRAGGDLWKRLATASFPASAYLGCIALVFLVTRFTPDHSAPLGVTAIVIATWALIPGAALLLGALPFLRASTF